MWDSNDFVMNQWIWVIYYDATKVKSADKNCPPIKFDGQHGVSYLGHKRPKMLKNSEWQAYRVDTILGQCEGFCLISYKTFQVDSLYRRCWSRALMTSSRLWIFNRCIFHIISTLLSSKYICHVFDNAKTSWWVLGGFQPLTFQHHKEGLLGGAGQEVFLPWSGDDNDWDW